MIAVFNMDINYSIMKSNLKGFVEFKQATLSSLTYAREVIIFSTANHHVEVLEVVV
jgi:hypothetical protein